MLVEPSLDELLTKVDNKFKLVTLALKRARQINDGGPAIEHYNAAKPVSMALQEIANSEVYVADDSEPEVDTKAPESRQENDGQALIQALSQEDQAAESADLGQLLSQGLNLDDLESVAFKLEDVVANVSDSQGLDDSLGLAQAVQAQAAPLVAEEETIEIIQPEDQPL